MVDIIEDINSNSDKVKNLNKQVDDIKDGLAKSTSDQDKIIKDANVANDIHQKLFDNVASFKYDKEEAKC
jgi:ribosomal protein L17